MAKALEILGFKVYDWKEHVTIHVDEWLDIYLKGKTPDFASMYKDVDAVTDHPAGFWYEEILQAFPDAKVIPAKCTRQRGCLAEKPSQRKRCGYVFKCWILG